MRQAGYIHGFGPGEERRLREQAEVLAPVVFEGLELPGRGRLLELGCGVGAELARIARRWPGLELFGIDLSASHLGAAASVLGARAALVRGDAQRLPFARGSLSAVLTVWMLEHVSDPERVLAEARRVLAPGGLLLCTEVDNARFRFSPEQPVIRDWWQDLCAQQRAAGADPEIGARLGALAERLGFDEIDTRDLPVVSSRERPGERVRLLAYVEDLLLSAAPMLERAGVADAARIEALRGDFARVRDDPAVDFGYHAVRLRARAPGP